MAPLLPAMVAAIYWFGDMPLVAGYFAAVAVVLAVWPSLRADR